jgi:hypothetical protein
VQSKRRERTKISWFFWRTKRVSQFFYLSRFLNRQDLKPYY